MSRISIDGAAKCSESPQGGSVSVSEQTAQDDAEVVGTCCAPFTLGYWLVGQAWCLLGAGGNARSTLGSSGASGLLPLIHQTGLIGCCLSIACTQLKRVAEC
jgi:hypothetical protein